MKDTNILHKIIACFTVLHTQSVLFLKLFVIIPAEICGIQASLYIITYILLVKSVYLNQLLSNEG